MVSRCRFTHGHASHWKSLVWLRPPPPAPSVSFYSSQFPPQKKCARSPALTREMFRQQVAGLLHAVDDARREFGLAKVTAHGVCQLPPEFVPALRMDGFVADDGKLVRARSHKNQH